MADRFPRGRAAIAGLATFGVGETPGYSAMELTAAAATRAVADAGLTLADVDALFICQPDDFFAGLSFAEHLGLRPGYTDNNRTGGSAFMSHMAVAALMLDAGYIDCALIAYGSNQRSAGGKLATRITHNQWDAPYAPLFPITSYALAAARHMHDYGTTRAQLAAVALSARRWAQTNEEAFARGPLTLDDCLSARMVSSPLSARDCCLVTDGAAAVVMTRTDRARDLAKPPVPLLAAAAATWWNAIAQAQDVTVTAAKESGARAMAMAGIGVSDLKLVQLYDAFTINTILFLEDLGFCAKGEGGPFVESGAIAPGGSLAVNTNGGGLSCCHPGMYGLFAIIEAARQIRGEAANQQPGIDVALAHGNGGTLSSQATVIVGSMAAL